MTLAAGVRFGPYEIQEAIGAGGMGTEPDWGALPSSTPTALRSLLRGCLDKDVSARIGDTSTLLFLMRDASAVAATSAAPATGQISRVTWSRFVAMAIGVALVLALAVWLGATYFAPEAAPPQRHGSWSTCRRRR